MGLCVFGFEWYRKIINNWIECFFECGIDSYFKLVVCCLVGFVDCFIYVCGICFRVWIYYSFVEYDYNVILVGFFIFYF